MIRRDLLCDGCALAGKPCPGVIAHCMSGQHCWDVEASCAAGWPYDPCTYCCSCKAPDPRLFGSPTAAPSTRPA